MKTKTAFLISTAMVLSIVIAALICQNQFADQIPVHWDINGKADSFAPKSQGLAWIIAPPVCIILLMAGIPLVSPKPFSVDSFRPTYNLLSLILVGLFCFISLVMLLAALGTPFNSGRVVVTGVMLFLAITGNFMGKIRKNLYVGIRTPWTLASDANWIATHRIGARLMVIGGVAGAILSACGWIVPGLVIFLASSLYPLLYSYLYFVKHEKNQSSEEVT